MSDDFNARLYHPGDESKLVSLLKTSYSKWPFFDINCSPIDHWMWRYNTPKQQTIVYLIPKNDNIIACGHNILNNVKINNKYYLGVYGSDLCVHPNYQGQGLQKKIAFYGLQMRKKAGVEFAYMVTINPKIINSSARKITYPYTIPFTIQYLNWIDDINKHIQEKGMKRDYLWKLKHLMSNIRSTHPKKENKNIMIKKVKKFDSRIDTFLDTVHREHDFIRYRTREFMNWRYCDPRAGDYDVNIVEENGKIIGYGVFRVNKLEDYYTGFVVDLLTISGRLDAVEELLQYALNSFKNQSVNHARAQ